MKEFRELVEESTTLMTYESLKDGVETTAKEVKTPLEVCTQQVVADNSVAIVPILRAGLGMVNGIHVLFPSARVGHIGMYRDEETLEPQTYYCKLPDGIENKLVLVVDPMLATGGSACDAIDLLKARGLAPKNAGRVKILARGVMTKTLTVYADRFSLQAVKMIVLAGGKAEQNK